VTAERARSVEPDVPRVSPPEPTGWVGWVFFAGIMMVMIGIFQAINGLTALFNDDFFLTTRNGLVVNLDFTTWGWVHLILGVVVLLAGFGLFAGATWARVVGVILAVVSAIANLAFISAYPVWSTIMIAVDVLVIYALTVHGAEARAQEP
jgi:hypothetical protein